MKTIGYITATVFVPIYGSILNGWALTVLWGWFMVKAFELPHLSIPLAIGLALIVNFLTWREDLQTKKYEKDEFTDILLRSFIGVTFKAGFSLAFGLIVKQFIR